jgi:hypothetical protein
LHVCDLAEAGEARKKVCRESESVNRTSDLARISARNLFLGTLVPQNPVGAGRGGFGPFVQQKPSQGAQVVEQPTAGLQMLFQLIQFELHDLQSLNSAFRPGGGGGTEVGFDLEFGFSDGLDQQPHVLVGILDSVKRGLEGIVQGREFLSKWEVWRRGILFPIDFFGYLH